MNLDGVAYCTPRKHRTFSNGTGCLEATVDFNPRISQCITNGDKCTHRKEDSSLSTYNEISGEASLA